MKVAQVQRACYGAQLTVCMKSTERLLNSHRCLALGRILMLTSATHVGGKTNMDDPKDGYNGSEKELLELLRGDTKPPLGSI
jgi:hypothetical protein